MQVTTKRSEQVWKSLDGQRTIYKVYFDVNGQEAMAKSYSSAIAAQGFSGQVETYEKQGNNGPETFVKQVPKEQVPGGGSGYTPRDDMAIRAQWSIGQAIIYVGEVAENVDRMETVEQIATKLFAMVDRVKEGIKPDPVITDVPDEPMSIKDLADVFPS
jgi:hypothetical protein